MSKPLPVNQINEIIVVCAIHFEILIRKMYMICFNVLDLTTTAVNFTCLIYFRDMGFMKRKQDEQ
jgi:hypothetical protein